MRTPGISLLVVLHLLTPLAASAQSSIGVPPHVRASIGPYGGIGGDAGPGGYLGALLYKDLLNPATGLLGAQAEGYAGWSEHHGWTGAVAVGVRSPTLRLGGGIELDLHGGELAPFVSVMHPVVRGGPFASGGVIHASISFGGQNTMRVGMALPIAQPLIGRDRPRNDRVKLRAASAHGIRAMGDLREHVLQISDLVVPPLEKRGEVGGLRTTLGDGSATDIIATYHVELDRMLGRDAADDVRSALLDSLILPYNKLIGQKRRPRNLAPFAAASLRAVNGRGEQATAALAGIIAALEEVVTIQRGRFGDERLTWLPLQLALRAEEYTTQAQLDALLERATAEEFSDSNEVVYVANDQFQWELYHSIRRARDYHVLWIHDFKGVNDAGRPDRVAYLQTAHGYLAALIERVNAYDAGGVWPEFHIILDQYYFELSRSREWMELLRDPLHARARVDGAPQDWGGTIDSLQAVLRGAVAGSQRLQEGARTNGVEWLREKIAVRVHVTQQADPSFFSGGVLPLIGLTDNALRDHRKLVFYDLTEADAYRGALIVSGMGVGELYNGPAWDDRAAILRGAAAHAVKRHAVKLLTTNALRASALPRWLQPVLDTIPQSERAPAPALDGQSFTTMQVHNDVGYGAKDATVAKAMLYSLMPAGSVVKVANPLWINPLWGSLLLGHALRGGRVLIVSPSLANSHFGKAEMSLVAEQLRRLVNARQDLAAAIERAGGMLAVGIYDVNIAADDIPSRIDTALARRARSPWLQRIEPFSQEVIDSLHAVAASLRASAGSDSGRVPAPERTKLHIKAHFAASAEAWENLFLQPGWGSALAQHFRALDELSKSRPKYVDFHRLDATTVTYVGGTLALRHELMSEQSDRVLYYLLVGSFNEDYRSALLDGESLLVMSNFGAAVGVPDLVLLPSMCIWMQSAEQVHEYLPRRVSWLTKVLRVMY